MTQETVLKTIDKVAKKLSHKYVFGFYDIEDIEQDIFIWSIEALEHYDPSRPLENFLSVYIANKLKNEKRNKYNRIDYKCSECETGEPDCPTCQSYLRRNTAKKSLMEPLDINQIRDMNEKSLSYYNDNESEIKEILDLIDANLEISLREDYLKMRSGVKITGFRRRIVMRRINEILEDA